MTDEPQEIPATESTVDAGLPATGGGKSEIASQLKDALGGSEPLSTQDKSPREQMRNQIAEGLAKATGEKPAGDAKPTDGRARGPDGKFIPTPQEVADAAAAGTTAAPAVAQPTTAAPTSWKKELHEKWAGLDPEIQAEITKRETDVAKGFEKYQNLRVHEPVLDFAAQVAPRLGTSGPQLVHQWAQAQEALLDPVRKGQAIQWLAKQYGVDLASIGAPAQQGQQPAAQQQQVDPNTWVDPDVAALKQQLAEVTNWKTQFEQQQQQQYQQHIHQTQSAKMSLIDQFSSEKDAAGQPVRPHLETVMPQMARLITDIKAANPQISDQEALQQAYDNAVWGNPTTREAVMQATKIAEDNERNLKARQRAQAAQRGAVSPATASPQGPPATSAPKGDIRDQMRGYLQQITA